MQGRKRIAEGLIRQKNRLWDDQSQHFRGFQESGARFPIGMAFALATVVTGPTNNLMGTARQLKVAWGVSGNAGASRTEAEIANEHSNFQSVAVAITFLPPTAKTKGQSFSGLPGRAAKIPTVSSQTVRGDARAWQAGRH